MTFGVFMQDVTVTRNAEAGAPQSKQICEEQEHEYEKEQPYFNVTSLPL